MHGVLLIGPVSRSWLVSMILVLVLMKMRWDEVVVVSDGKL